MFNEVIINVWSAVLKDFKRKLITPSEGRRKTVYPKKKLKKNLKADTVIINFRLTLENAKLSTTTATTKLCNLTRVHTIIDHRKLINAHIYIRIYIREMERGATYLCIYCIRMCIYSKYIK